MNKARRITVWFTIGVIAVVAAYDIYAISRGHDWTITAAVRAVSKHTSVIPMAFGLIAGYWLGRAKAQQDKEVSYDSYRDR